MEDTESLPEPAELEGRAPLQPLSPRELEVLALIAEGLPTKAIALRLGISKGTANYHVTNLYRKLKVHSRVEATNAYYRLFGTGPQPPDERPEP